jgi:hypothetical protein
LISSFVRVPELSRSSIRKMAVIASSENRSWLWGSSTDGAAWTMSSGWYVAGWIPVASNTRTAPSFPTQ